MGSTPGKFDYLKVSSIRDAVKALSEVENSKVLAGGQSLIPLLKTRIMTIDLLVDIGGIAALDSFREDNGFIEIGASYKVGSLEENRSVSKYIPALHEAAAGIADPLVRNMGTVGGNLSHADPGNDLPPVMTALDAEFVISGNGNQRVEKSDKFFQGAFSTGLSHNEVLTAVRIPRNGGNATSAFMKQAKSSGDFSLASVATVLHLDDDMNCLSSRTVLGSIFPRPYLMKSVDSHLQGKKINTGLLKEINNIVKNGISVESDFFASAEYKRYIASYLVTEALALAYKRAEAGLT